jgi:hypothetical protein
MQIHIAVRLDDHAQTVYVGTSREQVVAQVAAYCRQQPPDDWDVAGDAEDVTRILEKSTDEQIVRAYFRDAHKESVEFHTQFMNGRFVPMASDFRFELGKTYPTLEGKLVRIIAEKNEHRGYEVVQGDDREDEDGGHRYNRSTGVHCQGRVTGSPDDCPRNLIPVAIDDPRIVTRMDAGESVTA